MAEKRRPVHLAVLLGASAGIYAVSLAGATALQSSADLALMRDRAPFDSATSSLADGHDALETDIARAAQAYGDVAGSYDRLTPRLAATESSLDKLDASVAKVSGAARALPGRVALPARAALPQVSRSVSSRRAPATSATTGASGK